MMCLSPSFLSPSLSLSLLLSLSLALISLCLYLSPSRLFMVSKLWEQMHRYVSADNASVLSRWQKYSCRLFFTTVCHLGGGVGHGCRQSHSVPHNAPPVWYRVPEPCKRNQFTGRGEKSHYGKPPTVTYNTTIPNRRKQTSNPDRR